MRLGGILQGAGSGSDDSRDDKREVEPGGHGWYGGTTSRYNGEFLCYNVSQRHLVRGSQRRAGPDGTYPAVLLVDALVSVMEPVQLGFEKAQPVLIDDTFGAVIGRMGETRGRLNGTSAGSRRWRLPAAPHVLYRRLCGGRKFKYGRLWKRFSYLF